MLRRHRQFNPGFFSGAHHGQWNFLVLRDFLNQILEVDAQIGAQLDHALVVHRRVADFGDDVPFLQRVSRVGAVGLVHHHAFNGFVELEKLT